MSPIAETGAIAYTKYFWYAMIVGLFEYLNIKDTQIYILSILMILDTISWVLKQHKLDPKHITSYNMWQGLVKKLLTFMFFLSIALMLKWLEIDWWTYIKWILGILIVAETYSIAQNIYIYRTWEKVQEYDAVSIIIKFIWEQLLSLINKYIWKK